MSIPEDWPTQRVSMLTEDAPDWLIEMIKIVTMLPSNTVVTEDNIDENPNPG